MTETKPGTENTITLTIDEGTIVLVAEILRHKMGAEHVDCAAAEAAILEAATRLRPSSTQT